MPSYKDSPKPLRKGDPNPLFQEGDDTYVIKALSPMERERRADGSQHTNNRGSAVKPRGLDNSLYLGDDKIDKSAKSVSAQMEADINPDEVVKNFMKGKLAGADTDDEDQEKAVYYPPKKPGQPSSLPVSTGKFKPFDPKTNNPKPGPYKPK